MKKSETANENDVCYTFPKSELLDLVLKLKKEGFITQEQKKKIKGKKPF